MSMKDKYTIRTGCLETEHKEFPASEYQIEIFKTIEKGVNNLIINASAGSSKTTTIVNAIRFIPEKKKILFVAFNKDIVEKIRSEVEHKNVNVCTFHSLGFSILLEHLARVCDNKLIQNQDLINIDIYKYNNYINNNIDLITRFKETKSLGKRKNLYINNIKKLIDYSRYYLAFTIKEISRVGDLYGVIPVRDEYEVVRQVLLWGKENISSIDYTDMIWLPNVLNLTTKSNLYDWIFIDEAQDTSIAEQELVERCFRRGTKFVAIGDSFQQINIWAGSTEEAIERFQKHPNTITCKLPISYRCPKKVIELAKQYSDNIVAYEKAIEGEINYDVSIFEPKNNDMVLCRTTAPLIELHLKYLRCNKKSFIRGSENIKERFIDLINSTQCTLIDKNCITSDGLIPRIYTLLFDEIEKLKLNGLNDDDAVTHPSVLQLYDDIEAICVLSEGLTNVDELISKINTVFMGNENDAIVLSTVHKAKGLEADNIFIYYPSLMPLKLATKDWEIKTEDNLIYVAYTRAKKTLNFMKEDKYNHRMNGYFNIDKMKSQLDIIKEKIKYNKELGVTEKNYEQQIQTKQSIKLGEENKVQPIQNKKIKAGIKMRDFL